MEIRDFQLIMAGMIAARHPAGDGHPFVVALATRQKEDVIVALLHDSLEDGYSDVEELKSYFDSDIVDDVITLSKQPEEKYFDYVKHVKRMGGRPLRVKILDAKINYNRCKMRGDSLIRRYEKALKILEEQV